MNESQTAGVLSRLYAVVRVLLVVAIVVYLGWQIAVGRESLLGLQWDASDLLLSLFAAAVAFQSLPFAWLLLLRRAGLHRRGQLSGYLRVWWQSYLYRYVPGKVMLLVERARLGRALGVPPVAGAALTIVETLLAILAGSAVSLLAVFFYTDAAGDRVTASLVVVVALAVLPFAFRLVTRLPPVRRRFPELEAVELGHVDVLLMSVPYAIHYLLLGLSLFLLTRSSAGLDWAAFPGLCGIYALSHVISLVALIAPGGLGVREGALAVQLGRQLPAGFAEAIAIGSRVWFTLVELACYTFVIAATPRVAETDDPD